MRQANPIKSRLPAIFTDLLLVSLLPLWHNGNLERNKFKHLATLSIEKPILNETLTIMASGNLDLWDFSTASKLELDYNLTNAITLSLIGNLYLEGPDGKNGLYGEYHDFSSITFKGKMSF